MEEQDVFHRRKVIYGSCPDDRKSSKTSHLVHEYLETGLSIRAWWNNQRMARINAMNAWLFGVVSVILKVLRIADTVFKVTVLKDQSSNNDGDEGRFTFDASLIFVPGTAVLLLQLTALIMGFRGMLNDGSGLGGILHV
ncbi:hypothetical protein Peur_021764 [Populus x canadensis]